MAGQAEKKRAKHAEEYTQKYLSAVVVVNLVWFFLRVVWRWDTFGFWNKVGFLLFTAVTYITYNGIVSALNQGLDYEYYLDVFLVNVTSQFLVSFSNYGWLLYLSIPGFLGWKVVKLLLQYVFTPTADEVEDPKSKKKAEKKAKQAERGKFKVVR
mmetsp:Transcript_20893/g.55738  ORF Transcript_20893/g.55738 Transcript_20893/m.55738 type:complete len:155 (-) Transcript_20893:97-561(-)